MQIGTKIWAIDPCEMDFSKENALTVGKEYKVKIVEKAFFVIESDVFECHEFETSDFDKYFSLTPPKEGEFVQIAKGNYKAKDGTIKEGISINGKLYAPIEDLY